MGKGRAFTFKEKLEQVGLVGRVSSSYGYTDYFFQLVQFELYIINCTIIFIFIKHDAPHY